MSKRKKKSAKAEEPSGKKADEKSEQAGGTPPRDFFSSLSEGFKAAGAAAERYTRMGINLADLEKQRVQLKLAYARLGESVTRCWDAAPDIGVAAGDSSVKEQVRTVNDLRRKIRETELKIRNLQNKQSS